MLLGVPRFKPRLKRREKKKELKQKLKQELKNVLVDELIKVENERFIPLEENDRVKLNIDVLRSDNAFIGTPDEYKEFLLSNEETIFHVKTIPEWEPKNKVVTFVEDETWSFRESDLIRLDKERFRDVSSEENKQ